MANEQVIEKTIQLPMGYVFVARARPSTIKRTVFRLLPWAIVAMVPGNKQTKIATAVARRISPLSKYTIR